MDAAVCKRQALGFLARRDHSRLELERKLAARSWPEDVIADVLDALEGDGRLSTGRFAESFIRSRALRGQGPVRIRRELAERGVDDADFEPLIGDGDFDWRENACRAREKRFGADRPGDYKERARQARFLQQRGFDMEQIRFALDAGRDSD